MPFERYLSSILRKRQANSPVACVSQWNFMPLKKQHCVDIKESRITKEFHEASGNGIHSRVILCFAAFYVQKPTTVRREAKDPSMLESHFYCIDPCCPGRTPSWHFQLPS